MDRFVKKRLRCDIETDYPELESLKAHTVGAIRLQTDQTSNESTRSIPLGEPNTSTSICISDSAISTDNTDTRLLSFANPQSSSGVSASSASSLTSTSKWNVTHKIESRFFQKTWLKTFPWLTYDDVLARAYCRMCKQAKELHLLDDAKIVKGALIDDGCNDWKRTWTV